MISFFLCGCFLILLVFVIFVSDQIECVLSLSYVTHVQAARQQEMRPVHGRALQAPPVTVGHPSAAWPAAEKAYVHDPYAISQTQGTPTCVSSSTICD